LAAATIWNVSGQMKLSLILGINEVVTVTDYLYSSNLGDVAMSSEEKIEFFRIIIFLQGGGSSRFGHRQDFAGQVVGLIRFY
jgi:hypothetical protein